VAPILGLIVPNHHLRLSMNATPIGAIAVLPLEGFSTDPSRSYFADGMTEELVTRLAKVQSLSVILRTSAMRYKAEARREVPPCRKDEQKLRARAGPPTITITSDCPSLAGRRELRFEIDIPVTPCDGIRVLNARRALRKTRAACAAPCPTFTIPPQYAAHFVQTVFAGW
jgi:hypothetical protein